MYLTIKVLCPTGLTLGDTFREIRRIPQHRRRKHYRGDQVVSKISILI